MNILVIGGTRLLGAAVVGQLVQAEHELTILSRRPGAGTPRVSHLTGERTAVLQKLGGRHFDAVLDFIAYDQTGCEEALAALDCGLYVLISSTWMTRLAADASADQPVTIDPSRLSALPAITQKYLLGKHGAEAAVFAAKRSGSRSAVLRLPIFWGLNDHTGRVAFYLDRIHDGHPVIRVNGGANPSRILWCEDAARAIQAWLPIAGNAPLWEALPAQVVSVRDVIASLAAGAQARPGYADLDSEFLDSALPEYLDAEPLWREFAPSLSAHNIFTATRTTPTPCETWLADIARASPRSMQASPLRRREWACIDGKAAC